MPVISSTGRTVPRKIHKLVPLARSRTGAALKIYHLKHRTPDLPTQVRRAETHRPHGTRIQQLTDYRFRCVEKSPTRTATRSSSRADICHRHVEFGGFCLPSWRPQPLVHETGQKFEPGMCQLHGSLILGSGHPPAGLQSKVRHCPTWLRHLSGVSQIKRKRVCSHSMPHLLFFHSNFPTSILIQKNTQHLYHRFKIKIHHLFFYDNI